MVVCAAGLVLPSHEDYRKLDMVHKNALFKDAWRTFQQQWDSMASTLRALETLLGYWSAEPVPDEKGFVQPSAFKDMAAT